ncbi:MAG: hypothetical protein HY897_23265 [Deltaproteobacteria bacterium]|nr:hypothetical protein [Deltaproteobacteria bacterium]
MPWLCGCALAVAGFLNVSTAAAAVAVCVEVKAPDAKEREGFEKLVRDEVARHASHKAVEAGCATRLSVELFEVSGVRYLTARVGNEVPARYAVKDPADLGEALSKALTLVLGSDPVFLSEDVSRMSAAQRAARSVLVRGHNTWRIELYEVTARSPLGAAFAPGGAFSVTRGADHFGVFSRIYFGGLPGDEVREPALRLHAGGDVGAVYEFDAISSWSFYASAGAGVQLVRFEGRVDAPGISDVDTVTDFGFAGFVRVGARFLRIYEFDCDLFAAGYLPMFLTADTDSLLPSAWTSSLIAGIGVGF